MPKIRVIRVARLVVIDCWCRLLWSNNRMWWLLAVLLGVGVIPFSSLTDPDVLGSTYPFLPTIYYTVYSHFSIRNLLEEERGFRRGVVSFLEGRRMEVYHYYYYVTRYSK